MSPTRNPAGSLASALLLALLATGCQAGPGSNRTLTYGLTLAPTGIDPHLNASSELGIPLSSVYDTLIFQDPESGAFVPGLAKEWTISPDGLTYAFVLREDVVFHDGTPFNAQAVAANFDYILSPDHHSQKAAFMLGSLASVETDGEFEVSLHLHEPYAPLLDSLSQVYLGMASPLALDTWGATEYQFHQVGTGPYRFVEYIPNDHLTLERNPDYAWAPSVYEADTAAIDTIVFRFYEDAATRSLALQSGEIDIIGEVPARDASRLADTGDFTVYPVPIPGQPTQYLFNTQRPPTDETSVRQALILGVDRVALVEAVYGQYSPVAQGPLSAVTWGYTPDTAFPEFDPEQAEDLLLAAGWQDTDGDGVRQRGNTRFSLHIVAPQWGSNPDVAQLIQAAWVRLGAEVTLEVAPGFGALKEAQSAGAYNAIGINFFGMDPDLLRAMFASDGLYAWTGFADPAVDDLLRRASQLSQDPTRRQELYAEFASLARDQALLLPIRDYINLVVASNRVQGLRFSPQGWFPFLVDLRLAP
jgi:peptide/nickel transport system substrate-binding protein